MITEEKREFIINIVTNIVEKLDKEFHFSDKELDILLSDLFESLRKIADKRIQ